MFDNSLREYWMVSRQCWEQDRIECRDGDSEPEIWARGEMRSPDGTGRKVVSMEAEFGKRKHWVVV